MKRRIVAIIIVGVLTLCMLGSCAKKEQTDLDYVLDKKELIVGVTDFAPMDYVENGEWQGFDADMAKAFGESLGVEVTFKLITWDYKIMELNDKGIDCVWNGMTLTDEVKSSMETSKPYCTNAQVVVVKKDVAERYQTVESIKGLKYAVEAGSAGESEAKALGAQYVAAEAQADALMEVKSGTSEACIIDLLMAGATIGEGTDYEDLTYTVKLNSEEYGVGFRKGSELAEKLDSFFDAAYKDGSLMATAEKYGVQESIIAR